MRLEENLRISLDYMRSNRLALNTQKTKIFVLSKNQNTRKLVTLSAGDKTICHTRTITVLGVKFNDQLNWKDHVTNGQHSLVNQLKQRVTVLRGLVKHTSERFARQLATGLIMSKVEYAIALWGSAPQYLIDIIQKQLNKAAKAVLGVKSTRWSILRLMKEMGWLNVNNLIIYHKSCLIHRIIHTSKPEYIHERLTTRGPGNTRSRANNKLGPRPSHIGRTVFTNRTFISTAYETYNKLPGILTIIPSKHLFKVRLRRYLTNNDDLPSPYEGLYITFKQKADMRQTDTAVQHQPQPDQCLPSRPHPPPTGPQLTGRPPMPPQNADANVRHSPHPVRQTGPVT